MVGGSWSSENLHFPFVFTAHVKADDRLQPSVCSTTLWVGQVDKKATQQDLTNLFEEFGQIESINVSRSPLVVSLFLIFVSFSAACIKLEINFGFY